MICGGRLRQEAQAVQHRPWAPASIAECQESFCPKAKDEIPACLNSLSQDPYTYGYTEASEADPYTYGYAQASEADPYTYGCAQATERGPLHPWMYPDCREGSHMPAGVPMLQQGPPLNLWVHPGCREGPPTPAAAPSRVCLSHTDLGPGAHTAESLAFTSSARPGCTTPPWHCSPPQPSSLSGQAPCRPSHPAGGHQCRSQQT